MDETNLRNEELRISRIIEMYKKGKTLKEISLIYNASYPEIISLVKGVDMDANKPSCSRRPGRHFTAENQIKAIEMYQNKVSFPEISHSFGVSQKTVRDLIKEYNKQIKGSSETDQIAPKTCYNLPEETKQKIVNLYKGGRKIENLALEYGVTDKYILDILTRYRSKHSDFGVSLKKIRMTKTRKRKIPKVIDEEKIVEGNDMEDHNVDPLPSQEIDICPPDSKINAEKENILKAIEMHKSGYSMEEIALEVGSAPDDIHRMPFSLKTIHKDDDLLPNNQKCLTGKPKTEDEEIKISTIIEMYKEGKSLKDISAEVQESFQNILSYIKEFDVNLLKPEHIEYMKICPQVLVEELPYENQKMVLEMHRNNVPIIEISETFGISRDFIYRYIREYKKQQKVLQSKEIIAPRHHHFSFETKWKIVEMYKGGYGTVEIANEYGVTTTAIYKLIYNFKKKYPYHFLSIKGKELLTRTAENDVQKQESKKRKINNEDEAMKISKIIEMYKEGKSLQDISVEFQESYQQILSHIKEHDVNLLKPEHTEYITNIPQGTLNAVSAENKMKVIEMYKNKLSLKQIVESTGIGSTFKLYKIIEEYNKQNAGLSERDTITTQRNRFSNETKQKIIEMHKSGLSNEEIALEYGVSKDVVYEILRHIKRKYQDDNLLIKKEKPFKKTKSLFITKTKTIIEDKETKISKIIEMYKEGKSLQDISVEFQESYPQILSYIKDHDETILKSEHAQYMTIIPRSLINRIHAENKMKAIEMYKNNVRVSEISLACNVAEGTIHKHILNEKRRTDVLESDRIRSRLKVLTDQTKQKIIEMYKNHVPLKEISRSIGVCGITIHKYLQKVIEQGELSQTGYPKTMKQQILEMHENGRNIDELALEFDLSRKKVYKMIYDYNRSKQNDISIKKKTSLKQRYKSINEKEEEDKYEDDDDDKDQDQDQEKGKEKSKISEETKQKIVEMYKSGSKLDELAHEYGLKRRTVYEIIYDNNRKYKQEVIDKKRKPSKVIKKC